MKSTRLWSWFFLFSFSVLLITPLASVVIVASANASPESNYYFRFIVDQDGSTAVEINFNSTDTLGESWVFVPKYSSWSHTETGGQITQSQIIETDQVITESLYFYQAFRFRYQSTGFFNMTLRFDFDNGALIVERRGIFYSPQIGFQASSNGNALVIFDPSFQINSELAVVVGSEADYPVQRVELNRAFFALQENVVRLQIEFSVDTAPSETTVMSSDRIFTFSTPSIYESYARNVVRFYDQIYNRTARLFNVSLDGVQIQWFLPDFQSLLTVGGYVPVFTGGLGEININVVFIRTVNGTIEVIATHELIHRFLGKAGIPPNDFLWLHEGMAQYISVNLVSDLGYEGAETEKQNLESGTTELIQLLGGENFGMISLQDWTPSYQPPDADTSSLYVASYYIVSRLPQVVERDGFDYYERFFELIGELPTDVNGAKIKNTSELALYLSQAANASVASTLKRWGFSLTDLYESPIQELIAEAGKAVGNVNPVFQPYKTLADYFYQQALSSAEQGDWNRASSLLQISITLADLAPLLTFLTIIAILALLVLLLTKRSRRPRPAVPPPPTEILQPTT